MKWIIDFASQHEYVIYAVLILLGFLEGPFLSMICGVILKLGYLHLVPVYASLMAGDLIGDAVWYYIGYFFGHRFIRRFGKFFSISETGVAKVTRIFERYHERILVISKLSNGFGFALVTLMTAGMVRIPFGRYLTINLLGQFLWTGLLLSIGYYLGHAYLTINTLLGKASVVALAVVVVFAMYGYRKYLADRAEKMSI